jgi:hypothetical protein
MKLVLGGIAIVLVLGGAAAALFILKLPPFANSARPMASPAPTAVEAPAAEPAPVAATPAPPAQPRQPAKPAAESAGQNEKVVRLAAIYDQMPVEDATRVMAKLPDPLVQRLLSRMDERQVGKLLGAFPPDRSARLTQALAR